jgi:N6-L-threonylcarbamoyladenine synthase
MITLGIETSCDETALSILEYRGQKTKPIIHSELISSQINLHKEYGGVVPELAAREHLKNLPLLYSELFNKSAIDESSIESISVTAGPGLKGCLLMGYHFGEALSLALNIPLRLVHHIEGHIFSIALEVDSISEPFLALVVSGGHTEIVLVEEFGKYKILSKTIDDAAGEAFDKSANLLGFPYPGGAELAKLADSVDTSDFTLPRVMRNQEGFSFSGLKTAISRLVKEHLEDNTNNSIRANLAYAIQDSIVQSLVNKVEEQLKKHNIKHLVVCGGVSANHYLKNELNKLNETVYFSSSKYCTDNASMIAYVGARKLVEGIDDNLKSVVPRLSLEEFQC